MIKGGFFMKRSKKQGFTLIELIVVIAIIGVLAAILIPSIIGYVKNPNAQLMYPPQGRYMMLYSAFWLTMKTLRTHSSTAVLFSTM